MTRALLALLCLSVVTARAEPGYTQRMFRRAMSKDNLAVSGSLSMSPLYVLITVCDRKSRADRVICVSSNLLAGAIHEEYGLPYDMTGQRKEFEIAMHQPKRRFCFHRSKAAKNIACDYSPSTLAEVRRRLANMSRAQLRAEVDRQGTVKETPWWHTEKYQDAVAHVLLERGILVGYADNTHALYCDE